jgi:ferritin-like metal-binding protein YciE
MTKEELRELYIRELKDIFSAETQLTKALPKMARAASSEELQNGFLEHLGQTKVHVERLEQVLEMLEETATGEKCSGMEGLIQEGSDVMNEDFEGDVMDAALIAAAQRVEHYEIAAYGTVAAYADVLGETEQAAILRETLSEEKETDQKLAKMASQINSVAAEGMAAEKHENAAEDVKTPVQHRKPKKSRAA